MSDIYPYCGNGSDPKRFTLADGTEITLGPDEYIVTGEQLARLKKACLAIGAVEDAAGVCDSLLLGVIGELGVEAIEIPDELDAATTWLEDGDARVQETAGKLENEEEEL